jgi:hypothetical protein
VLVALTFEQNCLAEKIAKRVGMGKGAVQSCKKRSIDMILSGHHFLPSERKKRKDSVKKPAEAAVNEWCHSNESSNLDTDSYLVSSYQSERRCNWNNGSLPCVARVKSRDTV